MGKLHTALGALAAAAVLWIAWALLVLIAIGWRYEFLMGAAPLFVGFLSGAISQRRPFVPAAIFFASALSFFGPYLFVAHLLPEPRLGAFLKLVAYFSLAILGSAGSWVAVRRFRRESARKLL
ncbi:MAG: hypothetical protein KGM24_07925 [Elusimicrobia bacterium]|nr:hypothetical protein [Elusimicrobiota bacterium]